MRHGPGRFPTLTTALSAALAGSAAAATAALPPPATGTEDVSVTVTSLRSTHGKVMACITAKAAAFPDCSKDPAARHVSVPVEGSAVQFDFGEVAPGTYAISLFHDENGNGKLDTMMMIPREGFGFSRDAKIRFGPPRFAAAAFAVERSPVRQTVRMRYMF